MCTGYTLGEWIVGIGSSKSNMPIKGTGKEDKLQPVHINGLDGPYSKPSLELSWFEQHDQLTGLFAVKLSVGFSSQRDLAVSKLSGSARLIMMYCPDIVPCLT